jgi:NAD(P)-dependent dehydrogenase (short-subunit alcohol dehydrogenase family)
MTNYRTLFDLQGKTALVVGAGSGIGQAAAEGLAAFGAHVLCADVKLAEAEATAAQIQQAGDQAAALHLDMRDSAMIRAVVEQIGAVDVLVATPSINVRKPLLAISD